jgi:ribose 1,5-bisphosphokinase
MAGTLILVVGPSGVGKDTLLDGARVALGDDPSYVFPRRVITRAADAGGERHVAISPDDFEDAERKGAFVLSWRAHGHAYGVPGVVVQDLRAGRHVIVNVSRAILDQARSRFAPLAIIRIEASRAQLAERLARRGREDSKAIAARLERADAHAPESPDVDVLYNDGTREEGIAAFVALIRQQTSDQTTAQPA